MTEHTVFWRDKRLDELTSEEWESLCDGCARCCLQKLEDIDTGQTFFTRVACRLLDLETCRCKDYKNRLQLVGDCTNVAPLSEEKSKWLPPSCAYRRLNEGRELPAWHHLRCADRDAVHAAGMSVRDWAINEDYVDESLYAELIIDFDEDDQVYTP
ncbi:MAG: YcgN family cysteine cluster protein [Gammaproteobacteria bacterium]|nr:YcgN family cysteine cluster protein [Gammaproteobacteria bacterium]